MIGWSEGKSLTEVNPACLLLGYKQGMTNTTSLAESSSATQDYEQVFQQYLEVCNRAIEQNKNKFPYTEIWGERLKSLKEEAVVHAVIFDDRAKLAVKLRLTPDMKIEIAEKKPIPPEDAWPFTYQYLKRVVENPKEYIDNPAKLEWGWLKTILPSP